MKENVIKLNNKQELYNFISNVIIKTNSRLLIVERTPAILEKNREIYKEEYVKNILKSIDKNIMFLYLFDLIKTRQELYYLSPEERSYARLMIHKLKQKQVIKRNYFRFDPCRKDGIRPLVIVDDKLYIIIDSIKPYIILIKNKDISNELFDFYLSSDIILSDIELSAMLDLEYKDTEKVVVVDEKDNLLGFVPRKIAHQKKLLHRGIIIEIYCNNKLLISKRSTIKKIEPGKWDASVAGHCTPSDFVNKSIVDGYKECAIRELSEELGIQVNIDKLKFIGKYRVDTPSGETAILSLFRINLDSCDITKIKFNEEIERINLVSKTELYNLYYQKALTDWYSMILEQRGILGLGGESGETF